MKIFMAFRNVDMNEGNGPLVPDLAFEDKRDAEAYIDSQPGVQGRRFKWSTLPHGGHDWEVHEIDVIESKMWMRSYADVAAQLGPRSIDC